jgi:hypothetical protein
MTHECGCYPCIICGGHFYGCPEGDDPASNSREVMVDWGDGVKHAACRELAGAPLEAMWGDEPPPFPHDPDSTEVPPSGSSRSFQGVTICDPDHWERKREPRGGPDDCDWLSQLDG